MERIILTRKQKLRFWTPIVGGFWVIPGEQSYLDGDFFPNSFMYGVFICWHIVWIGLAFLLI